MTFRKLMLTTIAAATLAACGSERVSNPNDGPHARVRALTATQSATAVDLLVDGHVVANAVGYGSVSSFVNVTPGTHTVGFREVGTTAVSFEKSVSFGADTSYTLIAVDSSTVINPGVLTDTGSTVAAGKTKLRVVHFATHAPAIDVWRTQPDYTTPIRVMFPFAYKAASPYLESVPGVWTVAVTAEGTTTPNLYATGNISIPAGQSRTVVLLDNGSGGVEAVILDK